MSYQSAFNIEDLRRIAERRLPRVAYDFLAGGVEDHVSVNHNRAAFERIRLRPRTLVDVSGRSQQVSAFGKQFKSPFGIAPTGAAGLYGFAADIALARAARAAGIPFVLSTASFEPLEKVAQEAAGGTLWFQLYMSKDREPAQKLVTRALNAGYEALVVTTDLPVQPNREYNLRNGFTIPFRLNFANMIDGALHPRWLIGVFLRTLLDSGIPRFQNLDTNVGGRIIAKPMNEFRARREALNWDDFRWLRELWPHALFVKGIMRADDALLAAQHGADGVFVSNHGGRALDGALSPIEALPEIRAAVGKRLLLMLDSGIRRGSDIVKALALGADMAFVGRATLYGIAAGGEAGAQHAIGILRSEVDRVLALLGCPSVRELGTDYLWHPGPASVPAATGKIADISQMRAV
jgi:isopentenyl diphosphate isomerase/L-lactate dehydrogenase-like FMN-dependent dehydrogenase